MKVNDEGFLHEHNLETYGKVKDILKEANSCAVVQPTGTGKSYIMMKLLDDYKDEWKLVIDPSRDFLINLENKEAWTHNKTVTLTYMQISLRCDDIETMLAEYSVKPQFIKLIIIDEAHRALAPKWGAGLQQLLKLCINTKLVGLTATPVRYSENRNVIEELFDGRLAQNMNLSQAINRGILPKLTYVVGMHNINFDLTQLIRSTDNCGSKYMQKLIEEYRSDWSFDNHFSSILKKHLDTNKKSGKHIIFVSNIDEANRIYNQVEEWFKKLYKHSTIKVYNINSKSNTKREDTKEFFEPNDECEIKVALAVNLLNESFHSDEIRSISMFRGTQSLQVYMQQIGRGLMTSGDTPIIFDFVDNYYSLSKLSDELKCTTVTSIDGNPVKCGSIFDKFYDETEWFINDLEEFKELNNQNSARPYIHILEMMKQLNCDDILDIEDINKDFFDWAILMISKLILTANCFQNKGLEEILDTKFGVLSDILKRLGIQWYKLFVKWCNDKESIDKSQIKVLKSAFCKEVLLKQLEDRTLEWFESKGFTTNIRQNKEVLLTLLSKCNCNRFSYKTKLLNIENIANSENRYTFYKTFKIMESNIDSINRHKFLSKDFGDAVAYWIIELYKIEYKDRIEELHNIFNEYDYLVEFYRKVKKYNKYIDNINLVNRVDKLTVNATSLADLPREVIEIMTSYDVKTYESFNNHIAKSIGLNDDKKYIEGLIKSFTKGQVYEHKLFESVGIFKKQLEQKINLNNITWSKNIMDKYEYINRLITEILRLENELPGMGKEWLNKEMIKLNSLIESTMVKKSNTQCKTSASSKYLALVDNFDNIHALVNEIADKYKEEYIKNIEIATSKWKEVYGDNTVGNNKFAIACYALTMCSFSRQIMEDRCFTLKLSNQINTFLEWLPSCEKLNYENCPDNLWSVIKLVRILGKDVYYLISISFSKKTRKTFETMYNTFETNGEVSEELTLQLFDNFTKKDKSLIDSLNLSETINEGSNIAKICKQMIETYDSNLKLK